MRLPYGHFVRNPYGAVNRRRLLRRCTPHYFGQLRTHLLSLYRELYENTDPILPVEVVIPMIMDPETGEWRKKTMHERYNKNRQVDRSREQYLRKKSEKESKKAKESKQLRSVFKLSALF